MPYIRRPTLHDLNECYQIDASYITQRVWQMNLRTEANDIQIGFHLVRLPRAVEVPGSPPDDDLLQYWQRGDCLLVAQERNIIVGYIHMIPQSEEHLGWINRLVVTPDFRRQGIGTTLLEAALKWGRERRLRSALCAITTKNHPAIAFCLGRGFSFSGFNERIYTDQDIVLYFARGLR